MSSKSGSGPDATTDTTADTDSDESSPDRWADRGWYLALEYGLLPGKDRFLKRLEQLRNLGRFKELLEEGGRITYRNLFRKHELEEAWKVMTAVNPWRKKVGIYLNGEPVDWSDAHKIVWCTAYLYRENPCRGAPDKRDFDVGCDRKVSFAPFGWDRIEDRRRHVLSFSTLGRDGRLSFNVDALLDFLGAETCGRLCPLSPARAVRSWRHALEPVSLGELGWPSVVKVSEDLRSRLTVKTFDRDHGFTRHEDAPRLVGPVDLELRWFRGGPAVFQVSDLDGEPVSDEVDINPMLSDFLSEGGRIRAVRTGERYGQGPRRHLIEQVFNLTQWFQLEPDSSPLDYPGFDLNLLPSNNDLYKDWARRALERLSYDPDKVDSWSRLARAYGGADADDSEDDSEDEGETDDADES